MLIFWLGGSNKVFVVVVYWVWYCAVLDHRILRGAMKTQFTASLAVNMSQSQILLLWRTEREVLHWHLSHNATACSDGVGLLIVCVCMCVRACLCMRGIGGGGEFLHKCILKERNLRLLFYGFNIELPINFRTINIKALSNTPALTTFCLP